MILHYLRSGYQKIKQVLKKTGSTLGNRIRSLFFGGISEETLDQLEQLFYEADLGVKTAMELTEHIKVIHRKNPKMEVADLIKEVQSYLLSLIKNSTAPLNQASEKEQPTTILVIGVNGNGKTTTVAKLANFLKNNGNHVIIAAADTFRAAAADQLTIWADRIGVDIVKSKPNSDPAAVVFDALTAAKSRQCNVALIDTAGRLHTRTDLMQELEKIKRICHKVHPGSPHETLLILDATTGQNGVEQAKIFHSFTPITGLILTKLDGTSKGGVVIAIQRELNIPIKFIGVGEGLDDLEPFDPENFVEGLFQ